MSFSLNILINQSFYNKTNPDIFSNAKSNTLNSIAIDAEEACMNECPVRTGNLRASHYIVYDEDSAKIMNSAEYASDVIYGTDSRPPNDYPQRALNSLNGAYADVYYQILSGAGVLGL